MSTIEDVAKYSGFSTATVSRVLNNKGPVSEKAVLAIQEAMRQLDYHPNNMARALVMGHSNTIGVILPSHNTYFWNEVAVEMEKSAREIGYHIVFRFAEPDREEIDRCVSDLRASQVSGIIQAAGQREDVVKAANIPILSLISNRDGIPAVVSDDDQGGRLATRHLIERGCTYLVHISGDLSCSNHADQRSFAFIRECEHQGIPYRLYQGYSQQAPEEQCLTLIQHIFAENPRLDGIFAGNDIMAARCVSYALSRGIRIPDQLRVVGYDDISISSLLYPPPHHHPPELQNDFGHRRAHHCGHGQQRAALRTRPHPGGADRAPNHLVKSKRPVGKAILILSGILLWPERFCIFPFIGIFREKKVPESASAGSGAFCLAQVLASSVLVLFQVLEGDLLAGQPDIMPLIHL